MRRLVAAILLAGICSAASMVQAAASWQAAECEAVVATTPLCTPSGRYLDLDMVFHFITRLQNERVTVQELCAVDAAAADAETRCARQRDDNPHLAGLLRRLGVEWTARYRFGRADRAFARAYRVTQSARMQARSDISVLQSWAKLKLLMGDAAEASRLAQLQTSFARELSAGDDFYVYEYVDALRFQAEVFDRLGREKEADGARYKAWLLSQATDDCDGVCGRRSWKLDERQADDRVGPSHRLPPSRR